MTAQPSVLSKPFTETADAAQVYAQGITAGVLGATVIATWFLILDLLKGRVLYTPTVLGKALFERGDVLAGAESFAPSLEMTLMYTWVHGLVFCLIGVIASKLLALAETKPHTGFGILLLFVVFEFGFVGAAFIFAQPILSALAWPSILIGNLLAATAMWVYFRGRHPDLAIEP